MNEAASGEIATKRRGRALRILLVFVAILIVALAILWTQREPIAGDFLRRELERRGVQGSYDIARIGGRRQRLENIVIGDPRNPDLTAEWAEIFTRIGLGGASVTGIRAHGVRLKGRLVDGTFSFGQVDRLLPPPSGKPFTLPELDVALTDARMRLDLPNGPVGLKLEGTGKLNDGFTGKLAAVAPALNVADCRLSATTAWLDLSVSDRRPSIRGPVRLGGMACPRAGLALTGGSALVDARLAEALNRWNGSARLTLGDARLGANRLAQLGGTLSFAGRAAETKGKVDMTARRIAAAGVTGEGLRLDGAYQLGGTKQGFAIALGGKAQLARFALDRATLGSATSFAASADGTPAGPLARALADAIRRAGSDATASADFTVAQLGDAGSLQISALNASSRSGARLALAGNGIRYAWPGVSGAQVDGALTLAGGGFPETRIALRQAGPGAPIEGVATIAPYAAGGARIAFAPLRFGRAGAGTRFATNVTLDGPVADGRVTGLTLPLSGYLDGRGGFVLNPDCAPLAFRALAISGLALGPSRVRLCPDGPGLVARRGGRLAGGARLIAPRFVGQLGGSPVTIAAASARYGLGNSALAVSGVAVRLGEAESVTRLDIDSLTGSARDGGLAGRFAGLGGQIGNVPLIVSQAAGPWSFRNGALRLDGGLRVADADPDPRFAQLVSNDFTLRLADNRVTAAGLLSDPASGTPITRVTIAHNLSTGVGNAVLDVDELRFGDNFQPAALTRFAFGVVANVRAVIDGQGRIDWTRDGVRSTGVFRTTNADLAAAFGPVNAASTVIRFTDLLGLESAPNQRITLGSVNPGLAVLNGYVDYQLLAGQRVRIEGGRWPFAGGELLLDPAVLDLGVATERRLTFRVVGMDLAQFVTELDVKNVNMSGIMDGVLPLVFDANGGRIEGGRMVARPSGGTLAYVGEISNADLGIWGDIAFDALKSIAFQNLTIGLNGDLDGEMVSEIRFDGVSRGTIEPVATGLIAAIGGQVASQIQRLPFRFNIRIEAPFRQLLGTARGLYDPKVLIERNLPDLLRQQRGDVTPVIQAPESEDRR